MLFLSVFILLIWLSFYYDIYGKTKYKYFSYHAMMVVFILVAGLRWRLGIDTPPYLYDFYHEYPTLKHFSWADYSIGESPLYALLNSIVKTFVGRFYVVQIIHSAIINVLIFNYIKKHSRYIFTCLLFYAILCYTTYNMEIMRGSISIAICLFANDYILDRKWLKGYFLYCVALLFHPQTLLLFVLPLFIFLKFNKIGLLACFGAFIVGKFIMGFLGDYIFLFEANDVIANKVSGYASSDKYGVQSGNVNFYIIQIFPMLLYVSLSFLYLRNKKPSNSLVKLEPLIMLGIIFVIIRMNLEIAYRYVDYFKIYFALIFAEVFVILSQDFRFSRGPAYARSFLLFIPLLFVLVIHPYFFESGQGFRYIPYSSVIDRKVVKEREQRYVKMMPIGTAYPSPQNKEY